MPLANSIPSSRNTLVALIMTTAVVAAFAQSVLVRAEVAAAPLQLSDLCLAAPAHL